MHGHGMEYINKSGHLKFSWTTQQWNFFRFFNQNGKEYKFLSFVLALLVKNGSFCRLSRQKNTKLGPEGPTAALLQPTNAALRRAAIFLVISKYSSTCFLLHPKLRPCFVMGAVPTNFLCRAAKRSALQRSVSSQFVVRDVFTGFQTSSSQNIARPQFWIKEQQIYGCCI